MLFNSLEFAIFLPIVFLLYWFVFDYAIKRSIHQLLLQNLFVVIVSYIFYGWWDWRFLTLIALTSFLSWGSGLLIERHADTRTAKAYLAANITINLLILGIFKYFNFFVDSFCDLFGLTNSIAIKVILPVGISFYTFQALSYSIDVYRKKIAATKDIVAFFAYVSFFPQLVAGPIERATNLLPQFERKRTFDYSEAVDGMRRILWGLFKKVVVADNCATYVDRVWDNFPNESGSTLALAAILFSFQIYGDFSGYSDIAIGTARLFGIRLKDNFITPYFSRNVAEFWKRWHISLNTWFVDYVYIPLGGSRPKIPNSITNHQSSIINAEKYTKWITIRNTFVIFLLSGLWHGANWTYVTWGLYHALLFVPLILLGRTKVYTGTATWKQLPQILLTFALATLGWIIFRAPSIADAWQYICGIANKSLFSIPDTMSPVLNPTYLCLILMVSIEWFSRNGTPEYLLKPHLKIFRWLYYLTLCLLIFFYGNFHYTQFIYFQF